MTQSQNLVRAKLSLLELGSLLNIVSEACRVMGVSRQHFYDIKQAYETGGIAALAEYNLYSDCIHLTPTPSDVRSSAPENPRQRSCRVGDSGSISNPSEVSS